MPTQPVRLGDFRKELIPARDLTVILRIQADRSPDRVRQRAREWNEMLLTPLLVVVLTDGPDKGRKHICDGGTSWRAKTASYLPAGARDPGYVFSCLVREGTEQEAARLYLAVNRDNKKPTAVDNYNVGLAAKEPVFVAMHRALGMNNLTVGQRASFGADGEPGVVAGVAACERIMKAGYGEWDDWDRASAHLSWTLQLARRIYKDDHAHDADLLQAIARIGLFNPQFVHEVTIEDRFVQTVSALPAETWVAKAQASRASEQMATSGGSASRAAHMARVLVAAHNAKASKGEKLRADRR
jgi:hypothetical protein